MIWSPALRSAALSDISLSSNVVPPSLSVKTRERGALNTEEWMAM